MTSFDGDKESEKGFEGRLMVAGDHVASVAGCTWTVESQAAEMTREYFLL